MSEYIKNDFLSISKSADRFSSTSDVLCKSQKRKTEKLEYWLYWLKKMTEMMKTAADYFQPQLQFEEI